jgi:AcrR family transcriptional regulator
LIKVELRSPTRPAVESGIRNVQRTDTAAPALTEASRADARRNRAKVLAAAQAAFATAGAGVSLGEVARRAGVGAGTVYRHFPTKEVLLEAVLSQRVERLSRLAEGYAASPDPGAAFFAFVTEVVVSTPGNRDMCELLQGKDGWPRAVLLASGRRFSEALASLLGAAQRAGAVRPDLAVEDVTAIFTACVAIQQMREDRGVLAPMSALVIDALRDPNIRYGTPPSAGNHNVTCASCGAPIDRTGPGRPARYCGSACRQKAYRQRRALGPGSAGAPREAEEQE